MLRSPLLSIQQHLPRFIRYALTIAFLYGLWRLLADSLGLRSLLWGIKQETWVAIFALFGSLIITPFVQKQSEKLEGLSRAIADNRHLVEQSNADIIKFARQIEDRVDGIAVQQSLIISQLKQLEEIKQRQHQAEKDIVAIQSALHTSFILGHRNHQPPEHNPVQD